MMRIKKNNKSWCLLVRSSKRSVIQVSFSMVFGLIIGIIILLIVISFVIKSNKSEEMKLNIMLNKKLTNIFISSMSPIGEITSSITLDKTRELEFSCSDSGILYSVAKEHKERTLGNIIFANKKLKDKAFTIFSSQWRVPFYVTNFLYITTPNTKFYFCKPPTGADTNIKYIFNDINQTIKEQKIGSNFEYEILIDKEIVDCSTPLDLSGIGDDVDVNIIEISDSDPAPTVSISLPSNYRAHAKYIYIQPKAFLPYKPVDIDYANTYGLVHFYVYDTSSTGPSWKYQGNSLYYGKAMLLGAIFANDIDFYKCAKKIAFQRLRWIAEIYYRRSEKFYLNSSGFCRILYNRSANIYNYINLSVNDLINDNLLTYSTLYNTAIYPIAGTSLENSSLYIVNNYAVENSCIYLY